MGLVQMDTSLRMYLPKSLQHCTHAQTLERSGFVNMLGRPPFNYSDGTPFRRAGFMSTDRLLDDKDATIFKPCKTVRQCFEDKFTHHGVESTRRVYIRGEALGANANTGVGTAGSVMRDWQARDASKCGIFGTWLVDDNGSPVHQMCPGGLPTTLLCFIFHTRFFCVWDGAHFAVMRCRKHQFFIHVSSASGTAHTLLCMSLPPVGRLPVYGLVFPKVWVHLTKHRGILSTRMCKVCRQE